MLSRRLLARLCLTALALPLVGATTYSIMLGCGGSATPVNTIQTGVTAPSGTLATPGVLIISDDRSFQIQPGGMFNTPYAGACPQNPTTENYGEAESTGARRVRIAFPGLAEPLYGVLHFCTIHPGFHGSASRSYRLEVPEEYVRATDGGRVSVVFERYDHAGVTHPAWVLWMSREPMPRQGSGGSSLGGSTSSGDGNRRSNER